MKGEPMIMRSLVMVFVMACCTLPEFTHALTCPNKPSNATTIQTVSFNTSDGEGKMWELYPGAGQIQSIAGAEGTVSASILSPGQSTGGQQTIWPKPNTAAVQPLSNLYVCFRWKMNSQFVGLRVANKLVFLAAQDFTYGRISVNGFFGVKPFNTFNYPTPQPMYMYFGPNSSTAIWNNDHTCQLDFGLECAPNITASSMALDTWHTIEMYGIASSCSTCRNGTMKWWVNGILNGNYTNLNYGDTILNQWQINHTWDGAFGPQCYNATTNPNGRDCTNPQIHYFDEALFASVGGLPAGSGGGGTSPPSPPPNPDTPAGPPAVPTGLNAQKVTP